MQRRAQWQARLLVLLVYCIAVNRCSRLQLRERASQAPKVLPHVSECNFCWNCTVEAEAVPRSRSQRGVQQSDLALLSPHAFPTDDELAKRAKLPNCTACTGCSTHLSVLQKVHKDAIGNKTFASPKGMTSAWLFQAPYGEGVAVVKVQGVPYHHNTLKSISRLHPTVMAETIARQLAVDKIAASCGLEDVTVRVWVERVQAVTPGLGFHISWPALWMDLARGATLAHVWALPPAEVLALLQGKLRKEQLRSAAILDLLISHTDRNMRNVYIDAGGNLVVLDNEDTLGAQSALHGNLVNSVLLPTTLYYEHAVHGPKHPVNATTFPNEFELPAALLDYRCAGGEIGTKYPPKVAQCLKRITGAGVAELQATFGLPSEQDAAVLKTRAQEMTTKGFEWSLQYGAGPPRNRYLHFTLNPKPCCKMSWNPSSKKYKCAA